MKYDIAIARSCRFDFISHLKTLKLVSTIHDGVLFVVGLLCTCAMFTHHHVGPSAFAGIGTVAFCIGMFIVTIVILMEYADRMWKVDHSINVVVLRSWMFTVIVILSAYTSISIMIYSGYWFAVGCLGFAMIIPTVAILIEHYKDRSYNKQNWIQMLENVR